MICGIGTDICQIDRIEKAMENPRFLDRFFTAAEREHIKRRGTQSAAGIFAAKEAVAKALGTGFSGFSPACVEIVSDDSGKPTCSLTGGAQLRLQALGATDALVSISHDGGMALAFAIVQSAEAAR